MKSALIVASVVLLAGSAAMADAEDRRTHLSQFGKGGTGLTVENPARATRDTDRADYRLTGKAQEPDKQAIAEVNSVKHSGQVRVPIQDRE